MAELPSLSLAELRSAFTSRKASPVDLAEAVLARIDATQPTLNAFTALRDRDALLADARAAEARLARGEARPLEGIPLGVKDLEDGRRAAATCTGSLLFRDRVATHDSSAGRSGCAAAGAIVVGKTNTPEFGYTAITKNLRVRRHALAVEPRAHAGRLERRLGGGARRLACCPLVTASDGGGSIRIPAQLHRLLRAQAVARAASRAGRSTHWDYRTTRGVRPAHARRSRTRRCSSTSSPAPSPLRSAEPRRRAGPLVRGRARRALPRGCASASRPISATPSCSPTSPPRSEDAAQRLREARPPARAGRRAVRPQLGREWGLLGAFELAGRALRAVPARARGRVRARLPRGHARRGWQMTPRALARDRRRSASS